MFTARHKSIAFEQEGSTHKIIGARHRGISARQTQAARSTSKLQGESVLRTPDQVRWSPRLLECGGSKAMKSDFRVKNSLPRLIKHVRKDFYLLQRCDVRRALLGNADCRIQLGISKGQAVAEEIQRGACSGNAGGGTVCSAIHNRFLAIIHNGR